MVQEKITLRSKPSFDETFILSSSQMMEKNVFVTVGTTEFVELIKTATSDDILKVLRNLGFTKVLLQIGRGSFEPESLCESQNPAVEYYRYKEEISDDIHSADLVISHAGAGSVLDALGAGKPLLVVVNDQLMSNHQVELAQRLYQDGYLHYCTCSTLKKTLETVDFSTLLPFPSGEPTKFAQHLDNIMGFV
ncbi:LOW QUALITY PROTEIN: UDP-N-acetylglucosamine transferase subunit ALG13 homolog [Pomacea canaliculata]|uniref:LOW QUALITY PROTEIN: UDP-N-acetylglucosamine transferase subunit ALG13 homolog n=1 Tax=Pomacea canaliculata TaxID=400727 RepID=UPI000D72D7EF|nr:LOW QUALITY PROTEIN: UDP-N-acetylglucosamine transferase subunit ALG13 homolog [Pomacea canaliculata]